MFLRPVSPGAPSSSPLTRLLVLVSVSALLVALSPARAQPVPEDPVWGTYAAGIMYPVGSNFFAEMVGDDDPRCYMALTVAWVESEFIQFNLEIGTMQALIEGVPLAQAQAVMYENSPYFNDEIQCSLFAARGRDDMMAPGYYAVEASGAGFTKLFANSARSLTGSHRFIIMIYDAGDGETRMFRIGLAERPLGIWSEIVALLQREVLEGSEAACRSGPSIHGGGPPPAIWTSGPHYSLLGGPMERADLVERFGCEPTGAWICNRWATESVTYSHLPAACR